MGDFLKENAIAIGLAAGALTGFLIREGAMNDPDVTQEAADAMGVGAACGMSVLVAGTICLFK